MKTEFDIKLTERQPSIKNIGRKSIRHNFIPGVLYGRTQQNQSVQMDRHDFEKVFPRLRPNSLLGIELGGSKKTAYLKDYSINLRSRRMNHVDLLVVEADTEVTIPVPVEVKGIAKGVLKGGVMRLGKPNVVVRAAVKSVPKSIEVDVSDLEIGDHFAVSNLKAIDGLAFLEAPNQVLISILSTRSSTDADAPEAPQEAAASEEATSNEEKDG